MKDNKQYNKEYHLANKEKANEVSKKYHAKNKKAIALRKANKRKNRTDEEVIEDARKAKKYHSENLEKLRAKAVKYQTKRRKEDREFSLKNTLSTRVRRALTAQSSFKSSNLTDLMGCSVEDARSHIESQFTEGMSWDNHGLYGWHIDHIRPCASFDLTLDEEQRKCFHYSNLQPLWAEDNLIKSDKL